MHAYELDYEVVSVLANRKHSAESPASPVAAIGPHSANGPAAALPRCRTPQRLHTHFLVPRSVECASGSLCSKSSSSSRSSSPGSILHEQPQRHQHPPRLQQQQQQQQQQPLQQQPLQQQPLQQQEDARRLMKSRSLQGSPNPSAPHPWGLPGRNGKPFPLPSRRSAEPVCTPDLHARRHEPHVSESSSVRSSTSSSNMSCHRAPPKRSVTSSPLPGHTGPSSLPICNSLPNLGCRATSPPRQLAHRAKAGSLMHTPPQLQQRQKQQARAAPRQPPSQGPIKWPVPPARATSSSSAPRCAQEVASSSCPNSPFAVASQPQRQWKRFAQDGTLSATILARAEEKLHELAALEGERTSYPDSQGQAQMGPPSTGSSANFGGSAVQRHLQLSRSEASLFSLPAAAHKTTQHHFVQPDCAQSAAKTELDRHHQQQQQQQGSNTAGALASADLNAPADLDPAINDADALKLCLGMLRGTGRPPSCSDKDSSTRKSTPRLSPLSMSRYSKANTHSLNQPMDSSGSPADGNKAGSRLSRHAGCGTLGDSCPKEGGRGPRPLEGIQAAYKAAPASAAHHDKAATTSHAHHKVVALQGSPSGSDLSSWRSCPSLLPSECSADSLTYQEQPQLYHNLCNAMQCRSQDGLQLVDGARRRARRRSNMCNAKALFPLQDGASAASGLSPRSSPPRMPHQKQSTKCLCATNAVAFDEEAAELAEREYMAVSQKAHGSLDSESPEFMMAVAQLQAYRPIFIAPDRKPKAAKPGNTAAGPAGPKSDREEIEEIIRTQHEEAIARMLNGKDARQSRCTGPPKQQQCRPEERCASMEPKKEKRSDRKQVLQEVVVADMESESTDNEQGVSEAEDAVSVAGELADGKQEEAVAAPPAAPAAEECKQPAVAATAAATVREMVNEPQSPPAEKEPWKLWKMTTSDDVEGGVALEPGEFPADRKPPLWKPWRPLDLEHVGGWGSKESPADEKPSPWKPVRPLNPDHYNGSWGSKEPPADKKPPTWKPVQPCNPDHYDGSWDSKSPERSGSPAVSPVPWKPFWHTNPVDLSDLRPIDGSEKKGKPLQPMWRL
ncbi:hypothetical protein DUNSADRAFT_11942 [Dunaliella salina]|uniref:Uncharacterized protein n=1 Tax=Dunaliella salina TaxID=3046 RepID=A0ABQ7GCA7_DUNSA|nr:hypothetical protein DUNSADRAFT_11942 [Dunaliella salina]|eukprot:KAF5832242.1 hypothetical protein DUNSADRAFT_11942 [Dunaliella salina]